MSIAEELKTKLGDNLQLAELLANHGNFKIDLLYRRVAFSELVEKYLPK